MRILLVEDDKMIGESLQRALAKTGAALDWAKDGLAADDAIATHHYDLILLDLGLPKKDGISFLRSARHKLTSTFVLILTAQDEIQQRVAGLDAGADDYLVKPFALEELEARIRALLRRTSTGHSSEINVGPYKLDTAAKTLTYNARTHQLSAKEFALVHALLEHPQTVLSRSQLEDKLYSWTSEVSSNAVEVHVHQLRKKFGKTVIKNIRNLGYKVSET